MYSLRRIAIVSVFILGLLVGCGVMMIVVESVLKARHVGIHVLPRILTVR